ncbi:probable cytochrome P450 304a1 [Schistocerca nitens]|uniref:probable cytochrome P450 304a1 n=1 Tax=Schistocerca nitens TaxID=7011 RepID=UPI0021182064|nr:probable cytochrome P450 304a1 [Schistocerca nitens]
MAIAGILLAVLAVGLLAYHVIKAAYDKPPNFPPGPPRIPIWGSYIQLLLENYKFPYKVMHAFTRRYKSKLVGFYFGPLPVVVISDYEAAKEALNNPALQGRISNVAIKQRMPHRELGINFLEGEEAMEQRRFMLRYLRDFGFGRRSDRLEAEIESEMRELVELIRCGTGDKAVMQPSSYGEGCRRVLLPDALFPGFINGFMPVVAGSRLPRSADGTCRHLGLAGLQAARAGDATGGFLTLHPTLSSIAPKMSGYWDTVESAEKILGYFRKVIQEHEKTYSDDHMRDFIDRYLKEIKERQKTGEPSTYSTDQLGVMMFDTFLPSSMVQSTVLTWALMYVAFFPEVQKRVQQELDSIIGPSRLPNLNDRPNLPYTEATLRETMRFQTLLPIGIPHLALDDAKVKGYNIPKGTVVVTNLWSMHMDKDVWGDPDRFRPDRFLGPDGKITNKDYTLPFSTGKRVCPGETFARQNMFLMLAAILQNFFIRSDGVPPPCISNIPGVVETPPALWVEFQAR